MTANNPKQLNKEITAKTIQLADELCHLAARYRGAPENGASISECVSEYHRIYAELLTLGWDQGLDLECELPRELMPKEAP